MQFKMFVFCLLVLSTSAFAQNSDIINICDRGEVGNEIAKKVGSNCDKVSWNKLAQLKELELSYKVVEYPENSFSGLLNLESLSMEGQIEQIPLKALVTLRKLKSLTIRNNSLGLMMLPENSFLGLSNLEEITLDLQGASFQNGVFNGLNKLQKLTLESGLYSEKKATISPKVFENLNRLKELDLYIYNYESIDVGLIKNLKNLVKLRLSLGTVDLDGFLDELNNVKNLEIIAGKITDQTFSKLVSPEELKVQTCGVSSNAFQKLKSLKSLKVSMPGCDETSFEISSIKGLSNLEDADLNDVPVVELKNDSFVGLTSLKKLAIASRELSVIQAKAFSNIPQLLSLDIYGPIESIDESAFQGLSELEDIGLTQTYLTDLPKNLFKDLTSVRNANFDSNQFTSVPEAIKQLKNVEQIYLGGNQIESIPANSFNGLNYLSEINFEGNNISKIENNAFAGIPSLADVDLSKNEIRNLPSNEQLGVKNPISIKSEGNPLNEIRYASLAIDRNNGFYYGFAFDNEYRDSAEERAIEECNSRGGKCTTVLTWTGGGVGVYRTINGDVGTAFGWGLAETQNDADNIARKECLKRSDDIVCGNFVWAQNSKTSMATKVLYDASPEIESPEFVKIGNQIWTTKNLKLTKFRNGDPITEAKNNDEWNDYWKRRIPAFWRIPDSKHGFLYNMHVIRDTRNLAPKGWKIPSKNDFDILYKTIGGTEDSCKKLRGTTWVEPLRPEFRGTNTTGFSALPHHYTDPSSYKIENLDLLLWSNTSGVDEYGSNQYFIQLSPWLHSDACRTRTTGGQYLGMNVRLIKE